jgi:hypothetical protein
MLQERARGNPAEVVDAIDDLLIARAGDAGLSRDDLTLLLGGFVPSPSSPALWPAVKVSLPRFPWSTPERAIPN